MKKVLFVATVYRFLAFEENDIKLLKNMGYEIHTATNMYEDEWLRDDGKLDYLDLHKHQIDFPRRPFSKQSFLSYKQVKDLLDAENFDLMHCHTPVAAAIARAAARRSRKKGLKVIYTCHGFHFHKTSPKKYWMMFYPIEYLMAFYTDVIITINREDFHVAQKFHAADKRYIPGVGVDTSYISDRKVDQNALRAKFQIPQDAFLVLSIGELSDRKNHEVIIRAIANSNLDNVYYLICGAGEKLQELQNLCHKLDMAEKVIFTGYLTHEEIIDLCHICDIGALPSKVEGLGLAGIETLAAGKPLVASNIHGINDYVINDITGISCAPDDVGSFSDAIKKLKNDSAYYQKCSANAKKVAKRFDISKSKEEMERIYRDLLTDIPG